MTKYVLTKPPAGLYYKRMFELRKNSPAMNRGENQNVCEENQKRGIDI